MVIKAADTNTGMITSKESLSSLLPTFITWMSDDSNIKYRYILIYHLCDIFKSNTTADINGAGVHSLPESTRVYSWFYSGARVTRSLALCVCFVDRCLSFCTFFGNCVVCPSSIYGFRFPLWYLQTVLTLPENMSELTIVLGFGLVDPFCVVFCRPLFLAFSFSYCVVWPFSINDFLLALFHLQTFLSCRWLTNTRSINGIHCMEITLCYLLKIK
jgi:hypothetical protein